MKRDTGKKLYSISEAYRFFYEGMRTIRCMSRSRRKNELNLEFMERIMLAVTQVNACPARCVIQNSGNPILSIFTLHWFGRIIYCVTWSL